MWTRHAAPSNASAPLLPAAAGTAPLAAGNPGSAKQFSQLLQQAQAKSGMHTIAQGETLIGVVRNQAQALGIKLNANQEMRMAQQLASSNGIGNADLVFPGQSIRLTPIQAELQTLQSPASPASSLTMVQPVPASATSSPVNAAMVYDVRSPKFTPLTPALAATLNAVPSTPSASVAGAHPVLQQTLDRAVAKGFIPPAEKSAVYDKILQMADNLGFAPDDFARMTLMESDGMNPRASNQRCHGIIQFCDGPSRGAASAGYAANPRAILDLSVHKQLSLVDKYFDDVGLKSQGPAGLEDLYLSVLNPASRATAQSNVPLNIQGQQARALHVGSDTHAPITRQSIRQGLLSNAAARLGHMLPPAVRVQAQRAQQYVENNLP
jgi:hypothetical protein